MILQPFVDSHSLAGAVTLVADKDRVLALETVGYADIAAQKPMTDDTVFWIASQTKAITAAATLILVDEGQLILDDPVEKYLPEFREMWVTEEKNEEHILLKRPMHPFTVREILNHTGGFPFSIKVEHPTLDQLSLQDATHSYAMTSLLFQPGTRYQYSNVGINIAGRLLEVLSGLTYAEFMQKYLFDPLGMTDTTFWPDSQQVARLAKSYKPNTDKTDLEEMEIVQLRYPLDDTTRQAMPAGGLFSTVTDVLHFCQMLLNNGVFAGKRILSEAAVREMTRRQTEDSLSESYGLGLSVGEKDYGHSGAHATNMTVDPHHNRIYLWMVQHAGFPNNGSESYATFRKSAEERFLHE